MGKLFGKPLLLLEEPMRAAELLDDASCWRAAELLDDASCWRAAELLDEPIFSVALLYILVLLYNIFIVVGTFCNVTFSI